MVTTREQWFCDSFEITDGWVRDVELRDGLYGVSAPRVTAAPAPAARHGEVTPGRRKHGPGAFSLAVWCGDNDRGLLEARYEEILQAAAVQHRSPVWKRVLADGTSRVAVGRLVDAIAPESIGNQGMRFVLSVVVHSGFWRDETDSTDTLTGTGTLVLASKARATAPMDDLVSVLTGPATNPIVVDATTGLGWTYPGTVAAGQTLTVDSGALEVSGTGGLMPFIDEIEWTADRFLEVVQAVPGATPSVTFSASATSGATELAVTGKGAYLT